MKSFSTLITNKPWLFILLFVGIATYLVMGLGSLTTRNNYDSELPEDDPIVATNNQIKAIFDKKDIIAIGMESDNVLSPHSLEKVASISEDLKTIKGVLGDEITSLTTITDIAGDDSGLEVGDLIKEMPLTKADEEALKQRIDSNNLIKGRLIDEAAKFTMITATLEEGYDQSEVYREVKEITSKYTAEDTRFYLAGEPIQNEEIDKGIEGDIMLLMPLALLMTILGFIISFRRMKGVLLTTLLVILSILLTLGAMGHLNLPITVVSSTFPILMIAIASSYGIHMMHSYYHEGLHGGSKKEIVGRAINKVGKAILVTGVTSALGTGTLVIFKVLSIMEFGIICAMGVAVTVLITLVFLPAVLALTKAPKNRKKQQDAVTWLDRTLLNISKTALRHRGTVIGAYALVLLLSLWGISKINIGSDFIQDFPKGHPLRMAFTKMNERLGGVRYIDLMIDTQEEGGIKNPEVLKKMDEIQKFAQTFSFVGYTSSFADIIKRIHREIQGGDPALEVIPDSRALVANYLFLYEMGADPGDFSSLVDYDYQRGKVRIMLKTSKQDEHLMLYEALQAKSAALFPGIAKVEFGGEAMYWLAQIRYIITGKIYNIVLAIVIVLVLCVFLFRSLVHGLFSVVPLIVSIVSTFGIMGFFGVRLEMGTAIITAICVGIGIDFAVHYLARFKEELKKGGSFEATIESTVLGVGKPIIYDVLSNILGFCVYIFSGFLALQNFGWLVCLTMVTVSMSSIMLFPVLLSYFHRDKTVAVTPSSHPVNIKEEKELLSTLNN